MTRRILIVSEGSPGHISQSEGLARMLGGRMPLEVTRVETRHRFGGLVRLMVMKWMGRTGRRLPDAFVERFLDCKPGGLARPDLILASGGKAVFAAKSLSLALHSPLVFIGERKPYPSEWFDLVLTPSPMETGPRDVAIELIPTNIQPTPDGENAMSGGRLWAMLIGGDSKSHHYRQCDWAALGEAMNALALRYRIRWLVSSSRRTGTAAEEALRTSLEPDTIAEAVWWAREPRKCMARFLGACERAFVTQDSVTMVTECLSSGKPTAVLFPPKVHMQAGGFLDAYYSRLAERRRIVRVAIDALQPADIDDWTIIPCIAEDTAKPADVIMNRFFASDPT